MNYRKYINNPESLLKEGRAIMSASDDSKYLFRVFAVNMVLSGCTVEYVAEMGGVSKASVSNWVKSADENGFESLRNKRIPGRPSRLNDEQKAAIDLALQSNPDDYGFKIWNGSSLSEYIKNIFNISLGVRSCQKLFHELGFSRIRPQTFPSKGYEEIEERKEFKKNRDNQS